MSQDTTIYLAIDVTGFQKGFKHPFPFSPCAGTRRIPLPTPVCFRHQTCDFSNVRRPLCQTNDHTTLSLKISAQKSEGIGFLVAEAGLIDEKDIDDEKDFFDKLWFGRDS